MIWVCVAIQKWLWYYFWKRFELLEEYIIVIIQKNDKFIIWFLQNVYIGGNHN